ncbi:MAG TPA: heat-shock protein Hsp70, partial [Tahibacter sp.]|nr:heat-shock protein Hsp70 [Tahibacter sp.]
MQIGIDFGTSYSAAAASVGGRVHGIRFGDDAQFRTAVFFPAAVPDPTEFALTDELEAELDAHMRSARALERNAHDDWRRRVDEANRLPAARRADALALLS